MWRDVRWLVLVGTTSGCGWLSDAEVAEWLEGGTCDGDSTVADLPGCIPFYEDDDGDGFGGERSRCLCAGSDDFPTSMAGDCDDTNAAVNPGAVEVCDNDLVDEDCDPTTLNGEQVFYRDLDGDGFGTDSVQLACQADAEYRALEAGDCDDSDPTISSLAVEVCDGVDNDCNPETTEDNLVTVLSADGSIVVANAYEELQDAVYDAPSGGLVRVCPGAYGSVVVDRDLQIVGQGDADDIIIDAGGAGSAVMVAGVDLTLSDVTVTGGVGTEVGPGLLTGGGVFVSSGGTLSGHRIVVTGNAVDGVGAGIHASGDVSLEGALVYDNAATHDGGAMYVVGGTVSLVDTNLFYNQAARGAGVFLEDADLILENARISGNFGDNGGGLFIVGGAVVEAVDDSVGEVSSNSATVLGAGVLVMSPDETVILRNIVVADNVALEAGGGAAITRGTLKSERSDWVGTEPEACARANYREDVYVEGLRYCAGDQANFTCTEAGCEDDVSTSCPCTQ